VRNCYVLTTVPQQESRGSVQNVNANKRSILNSINMEVAHKNRAMAFRHGVHGNMALPCASFMDDRPSEYHNSIDYMGVQQGSSSRQLQKNKQISQDEEVEDTKTIIEFRNHFADRRKKAISAENRKASLTERFRRWKQKLREKYINYDYE
jgi:hypothetical protein